MTNNVVLPLSDGGRVELIDMLDAPKTSSEGDIQRNIFRFDAKGNMVWQVGAYNPFPVSTFTNIHLDEEGKLLAYNFDGGEYSIDLDSGIATPKLLKK